MEIHDYVLAWQIVFNALVENGFTGYDFFIMTFAFICFVFTIYGLIFVSLKIILKTGIKYLNKYKSDK